MIRKDWNKLLDKYLSTGNMSSDEYGELTELQIIIIQEIKKSFARFKNYERISTLEK